MKIPTSTNTFRIAALSAAVGFSAAGTSVPAFSQTILEEIIVTARQQEETLQDVPVAVSALGQEDLERYNVRDLQDAARLVPNFQVVSGGAGSGSSISLRGVGSSVESAAFDPSVALNVDGVVTNVGRFILVGQMDMRQIEVLRGPQSVYFGKSATAGVVSLLSNDPGQEFEALGKLSYETELEETRFEGMISGALTDTFGARLAVAVSETDEWRENVAAGQLEPGTGRPIVVENDWRNRESTDARLTLKWDPTDNLSAKLKLTYSNYEDDGPWSSAELVCGPNGTGLMNPSSLPLGLIPPGRDDCDINGNLGIEDAREELSPAADSFARGRWNGGVPYQDQDIFLGSLQFDWALSDTLDLTSITAYIDLDHNALESWGVVGIGAGYYNNTTESWSQEFRITSDYSGDLNFAGGLYYADMEQGLILDGASAGFAVFGAPDPVTGNGYDLTKRHVTDSETWSGFGVLYWQIADDWDLAAGIRYTDEAKEGSLYADYTHTFLTFGGFLPTGTEIDNLEFEDDQWTPDVALSWAFNDDINFYLSYKEGFKTGGIDNSALTTGSLLAPGGTDDLIFDSETSKGFEVGMKSTLLEGSMRLNATLFSYTYEDLQVQQFDAHLIQFRTFNASELETEGLELEMLWNTGVDGLLVRGNFAYTDAEYVDDFINIDGENLNGEPRQQSADVTGSIGATYEWALSNNWSMEFSGDARYNDGYTLAGFLESLEQDSYWLYDAAIRLYSRDDRYEFALVGTNLSDETVQFYSTSRPFSCLPSGDPAAPCDTSLGRQGQDQTIYTSNGRRYMLQFTYRY